MSIICKMIHLPGANIFIVSGFIVFVIPYYLLVQISKVKASKDKNEKILCVFKFVTILLLVSTSLLYFFSCHIFYISFILGFISLIIYLFFNYKVLSGQGNPEKAINKALIFIGLVTIFFIVISRQADNKLYKTISFIDDHVNTMTSISDTAINKDYKNFEKLNAQFPGFTSGSFTKAEKVKIVSDSIVKILNDIRNEAIVISEEIDKSKVDSIALYALKSRADRKIASDYFVQEKEDLKKGKAAIIKRSVKFYELQLNSIINDKDNMIKVAFNEGPFVDKKEGNAQSWEISMFYHTPLINDILYIDNLISSVRQAEYQALNYLHSKGQSDIIWYYWKKYQETKPKK